MPSLYLATAATNEPVTTAQMREHLVVEHTNDNTYIDMLISAARLAAETFCARQFMQATWEYRLDGDFPHEILLPRPPLKQVNSIKYIDTNGDTQMLASAIYQVDTYTEPGRVKTAYNQSWPSVRTDEYNTIVINYDTGYGTATSDVPDNIRHAIMMHVAEAYENRRTPKEARQWRSMPAAVELALWPYRCSFWGGFQ